MKDIIMLSMTYKGYVGSIEVSDEDNCLYRKVLNLPEDTMISYEGQTVTELEDDFKGAVDDYIEYMMSAVKTQVVTMQ